MTHYQRPDRKEPHRHRAAAMATMQRSAGFSRCGAYRYWLKRRWSDAPGVVFIGLNPSTADAHTDDATLRRIVNFAANWGFGAATVVNLFAWRTPRPEVLKRATDPIGPRNNHWLRKMARGGEPMVVAWGNHGIHQGRDRAVLALLEDPLCLGVTKAGHPRHPLYARGTARLSAFPPRH